VKRLASTVRAWVAFLVRTAVREPWDILRRDRAVLVILLAVPVLYPVVVSWLYARNQPAERPAVVVDADGSALSRRLARDLDATPEVAVVARAASLEAGWDALVRREAELVLFVPSDFSTRIKRGEQAEVKLWVNAANILTYGVSYPAAAALVADWNQRLGAEWLARKGVAPQVAADRVMPIRAETRHLYRPALGYGEFLVPGVLLLALQQMVLIGLAVSAGLAREAGTVGADGRRWPFAWVVGKGLGQQVFVIGAVAFLVAVVAPVFGWRFVVPGSVAALFLVFAAATLPMAVFAAELVEDRFASLQTLMFLTVPVLMMSGFAWPASQMPSWVRGVASLFPATFALRALRTLGSRTGDLGAVRAELAAMAACSAAWWAAAALAATWRRRRDARAAA
jgi:ABC-2 type transport system permease protein